MPKRETRNIALVVDDSPDTLSVLTDALEEAGMTVLVARDGDAALAIAERVTPDVVLMDAVMPGTDGFETCRRLKDEEQTRRIPVIFISAITETEERVEGLKLGAVDFVSKPFRTEELVARIGAHMELSRLRKQLEQRVAERTAELKAANEQLQVELVERIRAERALRESEVRFRSMADTAPVMIWTSGPDTKIDFCNLYALTFTGRTLEQLVVDGWKDTIHPDDLRLKYPAYLPIIAARHSYQAEYRVRRADGEYRWVLDRATPRFLENGQFLGYIGVQMDITDLKRSQEQLSATQKLESLGVLVAGVAHNFNNQMGAILAEADLALSELTPDLPAYGNVERINAVAMRAAGVVSLLMSYAGARSIPGVVPVNLNAITEETVNLFKATVAKHVEFRLHLTRDTPPICADISQVRQLVLNLLTNAWESLNGKPGSIEVTTSCVDIGSTESDDGYAGIRPGKYMRLEITDNGCGIREEDIPRIFDPFYTTKSLGRGLGLSAVQGIIRSLGGSVNVRSKPGSGSSFEILAPGCQTGMSV